MANSTVCQGKWKPIVEPRRAKPKTYRQAPTYWLKFYEEAVDWLSMGVDILEFVIAPKAPYERQWTGPMLFSMDCTKY